PLHSGTTTSGGHSTSSNRGRSGPPAGRSETTVPVCSYRSQPEHRTIQRLRAVPGDGLALRQEGIGNQVRVLADIAVAHVAGERYRASVAVRVTAGPPVIGRPPYRPAT